MSWAMRGVKRCIIPVGGTLGLAWAADEVYWHRTGQRTARAVKTGAVLLWEYKVRWTPESANLVHERVAKSIVECIRANEGLYVKFGQAMATMDVVLPPEYKRELDTLNDQATTFAFSEVKQVVEAEFGCKIDELFSEFDEKPIASASIAQVHRARLRVAHTKGNDSVRDIDGADVAVKIQKPNIPVQNGCDLMMYKVILSVLEYAFDLPLAWTYDYTRAQLLAELDFRIEALNGQKAAQQFSECVHLRDKVVVPRVHTSVSGERVLVMEWVDSIGSVSNGVALRRAGLKPEEIMRTATEVFGYQIFSTGHVHGDPHPGNLLVRLESATDPSTWKLVLLDHGLYCELPPTLRLQYADFWVAAALGDTDAAVRICRGWGIVDQDAAEMFASLTQFRRVRLNASRLQAVSGLFGGTASKLGDTGVKPDGKALIFEKSLDAIQNRKLNPEEVAALAAAHVRLKERAKKILGDTASFPQQLMFVGRNMNIIRSANFSLGRVVNRVAILAECAAAGSTLGGGILGSMDQRSRRRALRKFHMRVRLMLFVDSLLRFCQKAYGIANSIRQHTRCGSAS